MISDRITVSAPCLKYIFININIFITSLYRFPSNYSSLLVLTIEKPSFSLIGFFFKFIISFSEKKPYPFKTNLSF